MSDVVEAANCLLLKDCKDLQEIDDFLGKEGREPNPEWPWLSARESQTRLAEARSDWSDRAALEAGALERAH